MAKKPATSAQKPSKPDRDDRLKAALKANMARRKAQAKARTQPRSGSGEKLAED